MRFLVDECLPLDICDVLASLSFDALHVTRTALRGSSDDLIWDEAAAQGRILVTADLDFPLRREPQPPGLIMLRFPDTFSRLDIAGLFRWFVERAGLEHAEGNISVVQPGRVRLRRLSASS